jgi:hypothetical protein
MGHDRPILHWTFCQVVENTWAIGRFQRDVDQRLNWCSVNPNWNGTARRLEIRLSSLMGAEG